MALFKIKRGLAANLPTSYVEGYCYVTTDDGKFYIDTSNSAAGRIVLNAEKADKATALATSRSLQTNLASTTAASFNGTGNASIGVTGTLAVGNGGTGKTSWTQYGLVYASASTTLASLGVGTSGQVLSTKGTTGAPQWINQSSLAAGTAGKFASAQTIALTGDVTGSASSQAGWSIAATLANSGVTAGSYGPNANVSPAHGGTFSVPYVTFDAKGRATAASTKTITLPIYAAFTGATSSKAGTAGLVPAPAKGQQGYFLRGDGTWYNFLDLNSTALDTISEIKAAWESADGTLQSTLEAAIGAKVSIGSNEYIKGLSISGKIITYTKGDGTTGTLTTQDNDTHYTASLLLGASGATSTSTSAVSNPYIILRENGTNRNQIQIKAGTNVTVSGDDGIITISSSYTDTNTHYTTKIYAGSSGATSNSTSAVSNPYLTVVDDTTYRAQVRFVGSGGTSISANGGTITISSSTYTLPTASTTLGGVKTTSTVTSNSGYTACPIINGVVYYKDTNTHAVSSVNSKTGAVSLIYSDVGAAPSSHTHDDRYYTEDECDARFLTGSRSAYNVNTLYNAGMYMVASGSNCPSGSQYGVVLTLPYRQFSGNTTPDFGVQIFVPNGDDTTKPDSLFFRTSLSTSWRSWKEVSVVGHTHSYLPLSGGTVTGVTTFSNTTASSSTSTGAVKISGGLGVAGNIYGSKVYGAVWNDYAEYRWVLKDKATDKMPEPGRCVVENGNDSMSISTSRLQPGAKIISDTYGMCMGETEKAKTPIAVCGRVLAHPFERKVAFNVGDAVCSGPNGTVSRMTREEIMMYPERIVGTVVSKPTYKEWGPNKIPVNGRIWIQVK